MANPAPTINQINAFNATQGTTIDFNIIGGTELIRSNRIYIYDLSDNSLICTHLYVSTESIHELPPNTDGSIVYESGKSSADFVNGAQYYAQIQTYTDTNGTQGGGGLSVAKMFWCLGDPTLTITTIPSTISTTSYNISATYTDTSASVVSNIIQQYQFNLYSATGSLLQSSGVVVGSGTQQGTSAVYDISYNFTGLNVGSSYYVTVNVTTTQGMSVTTQSNTFTVSIDTPTLGEATVVNNACDGYISVTSNLSGEYGGSGSGEIVSFETDSENVFSKLQVDLEPTQEGSGDPSPSNVRPIRGHSGVDVNVGGKNFCNGTAYKCGINTSIAAIIDNTPITSPYTNASRYHGVGFICNLKGGETYALSTDADGLGNYIFWALYETIEDASNINNNIKYGYSEAPTITTDTDCVLVFMRYADTAQVVTWTYAQVELGSTATPYEPYQQPQTITQDFNVSLTPTSTDTTPYLFKAVGDVYGDRLEDKIVGGTVAWNQLAKYKAGYSETKWGVTAVAEADGLVLNGTATVTDWTYQFTSASFMQYRFEIGRVYYIRGLKTLDDDAYCRVVGNGTDGLYKFSSISPYVMLRTYVKEGVTYNNYKISLEFFDLTQMFGSTIADYIYSLEQSQAGAGVAWFKKLFPNDYYEYNAGELLSVEGLQSHDMVGFNQWDEEWDNINVDIRNGNTAPSTTTIGSKNFCPILPSTAYYATCGKTDGGSQNKYYLGLIFYDENKQYISSGYYNNLVFKTPEKARFFKITTNTGTVIYGNTYNHDICINLSNPSRNGEYEPYEKHSYPLDSSLTLRGIPKLDASNNLYYDGDEYTSDGKVKRKYGIVDLGTLTWNWRENRSHWITYLASTNIRPKFSSNAVAINGLSNKYIIDTGGNVYNNTNPMSLGCEDGNKFTCFNGSDTEKPSGLLVYELATPTTETATPYTNPQIVSKYGTLEYVTNSIVPVGHKTTYLTRDIFGGYVDLISGKLVVTHEVTMMDSTWDWLMYQFSADGGITANQFYVNDKIPLPVGRREILCNAFNPILINDRNHYNMSAYLSSSGYCFRYDGITSVADWKTFLATNEIFVYHELASPQTYQLTPQQVNTLVGTNNVWSEQGNIELSYHIPITNLLVKRQDVDDVSGGWLTLYSQPITQASDMDFTFIDFLNQYGKTYKYALVPLLTQTQSGVEVEVEGGYTVSNEVQSVFDGVFIADSTGSQKCKANVGYGNVDMNQVVGSITPIGAKYPIIVTNSHNQYHNGSISGTIVPDDYYFNGNLSRIDMVKKRNELEQFLTNKRVKVIKDWNGNIWLVMIAGNVSCTFNNNYGMGIVSFSTNWTEVGDPTNQQDLQATGLINVGGV